MILLGILSLFPIIGLKAGDLIPSLEDVIGKPPVRESMFNKKEPPVFYTLGLEEPDPEMKEMIQKQRQGFILSPEEQELMNLYFQHGSISGNNPLIRKVSPTALTWSERRIKTPSGTRLPFIYCHPRDKGPFPVALVLDPEVGMQMEVGKEEYSQVTRLIPAERELPYDDSFRGRYITHNPIGNRLMSHGVAVVIPILETLENLDSIPVEDWKAVMDYLLSNKVMDEESVFLVSTKEYAATALRLGSQMELEGLIVEEPESGIFGTTLPSSFEDAVAMTELIKQYESVTQSIDFPILILRNKLNPVLRINDAALLNPLIYNGKQLFLSMTDRPLRTLEPVTPVQEEDTSDPDAAEHYAYDVEAMEALSNRILHFVQQNGASPLRLLAERSQTPRLANRSQSALNELERIEGRLAGWMNDPSSSNLNGDLNFDGSVSGDSAFGDFDAESNAGNIEE